MSPARALPAADLIALAGLVDRYAALVDDREFAALAALFTEDAVLHQPQPPKRMTPSGTVVGRSAIEENFAQLRAVEATQHAIVGRVFDAADSPETPDGPARAAGRIGCIAHHVSGSDAAAGGHGRTDHAWHLTYRDRYRRVGSVWLIAERTLDLHWIEARRVAL